MLKYRSIFFFDQTKPAEVRTRYLLIFVIFTSTLGPTSWFQLPPGAGPTLLIGWVRCQSQTPSRILLLANTMHTRSQKVQFRRGDQTGRVGFRVRFTLSAAIRLHSKEAKSSHFLNVSLQRALAGIGKREEVNWSWGFVCSFLRPRGRLRTWVRRNMTLAQPSSWTIMVTLLTGDMPAVVSLGKCASFHCGVTTGDQVSSGGADVALWRSAPVWWQPGFDGAQEFGMQESP